MGSEAILDPDVRICDAHHHLWDHIEPVYLPDDLRRDIATGHRVERAVYIEARSHYRKTGPADLRPVGETEWVVGLDTTGGIAAAIVGFADLTMGDAVEDVLLAHVEAGRGRFRGVRHPAAWDPSPQIRNAACDPPERMFDLPEFRQGIAALARLGLSFDAWLFHPQLAELVDLARSRPEVTIVLDHLGGPLGIGPYAGRRDEVLSQLRTSLRQLAGCENKVLKMGGIGMTIFGFGWHKRENRPSSEEMAETWGPTIRWCIDTFGPDRCMFESNFPVDRHSAYYVVLWNAFKRITADLSVAERAALFYDTAARVYHLDNA